MSESTEQFTKHHSSKFISWINRCEHYELSEDFMRANIDKLKWVSISIHQTLSENFIRDFDDKVNWHCISEYQKLSEEFKIEMQLKGYLVAS